MDEFWMNFWSNLLADALIAVIVYYALDIPSERRRKREERARRASQIRQTLGLLRAELDVNRSRARSYIQALNRGSDLSELFPLRFTRGAWNAIKESNILPEISDTNLVYHLLRMNEAALIANKNLRKLQLAYIDGKKRKPTLSEIARRDCENFLKHLLAARALMEQMSLPYAGRSEINDSIFD